MKWSLKLGTVAGIGIYLHWTFAILIGWLFISYLSMGQSAVQALQGIGFIMALFGCVVLHELGHALTAKRYGVRTRDITLLPIGGVARLERIPEDPRQEFWIAIAGPAVNVVIAALLLGVIVAAGLTQEVFRLESLQGSFWVRLMWVNLFLVAFNMLPAFPMDGGRVLRALLATRLGRRRATAIAANIGQAMAILFGIAGLFFNPFLVFIAIFVYLGAQVEAQQVEVAVALEGLRVRDAMLTRFRSLSAEDSLERAVKELLAGSQQDFPVVRGAEVVGMLRRTDLIKALAEGPPQRPVGEVMSSDCRTVRDSDMLTRVIDAMRESRCSSVPVLRDGDLAGLLTMENVGELVMVQSAFSGTPPILANTTEAVGSQR
jgi:Zn-dependent protease/predicted transcriptional regulator